MMLRAYFQEKFSNASHGEDWNQCNVCGQWIHVEITSSDDIDFVYNLCAAYIYVEINCDELLLFKTHEKVSKIG